MASNTTNALLPRIRMSEGGFDGAALVLVRPAQTVRLVDAVRVPLRLLQRALPHVGGDGSQVAAAILTPELVQN